VDDTSDLISWWVDRLADPAGGLTERMAWFWHGLLTTSADKGGHPGLVATQLDLFRTQGRSDYRTLLQEFVGGGALLQYLDASNSMAANPNENLARELMELFTIGRGAYSEDDVRAAARALAGWVVEDDRVEFRRNNAFVAPLLFLGEQADWDLGLVVDRLCDHPATAIRVAGRLWSDLVGVAPNPDRAIELGAWWQQRGLAIDPLLERIFDEPAFGAHPLIRARSGLEWFCAARSAVDGAGGAWPFTDPWSTEGLGQLPYRPPSVAGWPGGDRWLAPGSLLARASMVHNLGHDHLGSAPTHPGDILAACGLHQVSEATAEAVLRADRALPDGSMPDPDSIRLVRWRLALTCPEFHLS
jgi:uncharacterized protein (DUF1800 family)